MRTTVLLISFVALALLGKGAPADANTPKIALTLGAGAFWPPDDLGFEESHVQMGGMLGVRIHPSWMLEGRAHFADGLDAESGIAPQTDWLHAGGNATWFATPERAFSWYLTGGIGSWQVRPEGGSETSRLALNLGGGLRHEVAQGLWLRADLREAIFDDPTTSADKLVFSPEVFAGFTIGFGTEERAPDPDSDGDGVPDRLDRCPGTASGVRVDEHGCTIPETPRERDLLETGVIRLEDVFFDTAKSELRTDARGTLDEVGRILSRYPDLKIEIGGHTDSRDTEEFNQRLSEDRANAVRTYLLSRFQRLRRDNLQARGYGESKPVASNETEEGMAKNRRVEFRVLNREAMERRR